VSRPRLVILTEIISPYRIPLFNDLAARAEVVPHVIFLAETDPNLRQWQIYKEEIRFSYEVLPSWRKRAGGYNLLLNRGVGRALKAASPDAILCGGYNYVASWQALAWARVHGVPFLLWSESNTQDMRRGHALVELLKDRFLRLCTGFVVPGQSAANYLRSRKIKQERISTALNAVDNELYARAAADARWNAIKFRREAGLPERYILFVGRLVREKGVFDLLAAYARLEPTFRRHLGLVFVGDGVARAALQEQAAAISPGTVIFSGFAQREQLGPYYALAELLVLPTYSDTWGLVVNEGMACGLPVIVSHKAGCAADLVRENWNGALIAPGDVPGLTSVLHRLVDNPGMCARMGANSLELISRFSPAEWSAGIARAVAATIPQAISAIR
jgi:glycosyltransferase involved in cell wall biosynthesis